MPDPLSRNHRMCDSMKVKKIIGLIPWYFINNEVGLLERNKALVCRQWREKNCEYPMARQDRQGRIGLRITWSVWKVHPAIDRISHQFSEYRLLAETKPLISAFADSERETIRIDGMAREITTSVRSSPWAFQFLDFALSIQI